MRCPPRQPTNFDKIIGFDNLIGFDELFNILEVKQNNKHIKTDFPPHNLLKLSDNKYVLSLAIVGRNKSEIDIELKEDILTVSSGSISHDNAKILYQGIAFRSFKKQFKLHEYIEITSAELENGILNIYMTHTAPKEKLTKTINIK